MDRGYPPSKWDRWDQPSGSSSHKTTPGGITEALLNTSDQAKRDKLSQAYGRSLLSALNAAQSQPSSASSSSKLIRSPASDDDDDDDEARVNPFPREFPQKRADRSKRQAAASVGPQMSIHGSSSKPFPPGNTLDAEAIRQQIMLAGINALAMNNPSLQTQLLLGQNVNPLSNLNPLVNLTNLALGGIMKAPIPDGSGLLKYSAPDISSLVFDQKAGYKFDSTTGLHYDANSGLFINLERKIFLRWDPLLNTYVRVDLPSSGHPLAVGVAPQNSSSVVSSSSATVGVDTLPNLLTTGLNLPVGQTALTRQIQNPGLSLGAMQEVDASRSAHDPFMSEIWERMRAYAKEASGLQSDPPEKSKVLKERAKSSSRSRSPSSDEKSKRKKSKKRSSKRTEKRSKESNKGKKRTKRRSRSLSTKRSKRKKKDRSSSSSRSSSAGSRSSSRAGRSNRRRPRRSASRSPSHSQDARSATRGKKRSRSGNRRSRSKGAKRSHSRGRRSDSRGSRSSSRSSDHTGRAKKVGRGRRSSSRGPRNSSSVSPHRKRATRRSRSRGAKRSRSRERRSADRRARSRSRERSRSRVARRSRSRGRRSADRRARSHSRERSRSRDRGHKRTSRFKHGERAHSRERRPYKRQHSSNYWPTKDTASGDKPWKTKKKRLPENDQTEESDVLSDFDFLKDTLDDDENLESEETKKEVIQDLGDVLGHLFIDNRNNLSDVVLVAPVPLQGDSCNAKTLKNRMMEHEGVSKVSVFDERLSGTPCHYMLVYFQTVEAATQFYDLNNGAIILEVDEGCRMKGYLHFVEKCNWICVHCKAVNFAMRVLCHKCYQAGRNGSSPVSVVDVPTKWVGISKLKNCFATEQSVLDSLPSLEHFEIQTVRMLFDAKGFTLGLCVFEVQSDTEGAQLHAFFRQHGRSSIYVRMNEPAAPKAETVVSAAPKAETVVSAAPKAEISTKPVQSTEDVSRLFAGVSTSSIIMVAAIPLSNVVKNTKTELAFFESFIQSSLRAADAKYESISLHFEKTVGSPWTYALIHFESPDAAAQWRSKQSNSLTINTTGLGIVTSGDPIVTVSLHFSKDNWTCRNCQTANFPFRSLCHQCFIHRDENTSGPVKKSMSTTRWVATSKLTKWFDADECIMADLENLMQDVKLKKISVLRDPNFPIFPLACVLETESWGESLRLREFLHRTGRFSQFVNLTQCFDVFTGSVSSGETPQAQVAGSDKTVPAFVSHQNNEIGGKPLASETPIDENRFGRQEDSIDNSMEAGSVLQEQGIGGRKEPEEIPAEMGQADEVIPDLSRNTHLLWWDSEATRYSDVLNRLFHRSSPAQTVFVGPLSALPSLKHSARAFKKIIVNKLEQDNLNFVDINFFNSSGPCNYALVNFTTLHDAVTWQSMHKDGLVLPSLPAMVQKGDPKFFRTFVYFCKPNWRCTNCSKSNFGLRECCCNCLRHKEQAPPIITFARTPTLCVCISKYQRCSVTEEALYENFPSLKDVKESLTIKYLKEESGAPLGVCVLEANNLDVAQRVYSEIREQLGGGRKGISYGKLNAYEQFDGVVEDGTKGMFNDSQDPETLPEAVSQALDKSPASEKNFQVVDVSNQSPLSNGSLGEQLDLQLESATDCDKSHDLETSPEAVAHVPLSLAAVHDDERDCTASEVGSAVVDEPGLQLETDTDCDKSQDPETLPEAVSQALDKPQSPATVHVAGDECTPSEKDCQVGDVLDKSPHSNGSLGEQPNFLLETATDCNQSQDPETLSEAVSQVFQKPQSPAAVTADNECAASETDCQVLDVSLHSPDSYGNGEEPGLQLESATDCHESQGPVTVAHDMPQSLATVYDGENECTASEVGSAVVDEPNQSPHSDGSPGEQSGLQLETDNDCDKSQDPETLPEAVSQEFQKLQSPATVAVENECGEALTLDHDNPQSMATIFDAENGCSASEMDCQVVDTSRHSPDSYGSLREQPGSHLETATDCNEPTGSVKQPDSTVDSNQRLDPEECPVAQRESAIDDDRDSGPVVESQAHEMIPPSADTPSEAAPSVSEPSSSSNEPNLQEESQNHENSVEVPETVQEDQKSLYVTDS